MPAAAKVLIVDDESHVRAYVSMVLQATFADLEILEAESDTAAVDVFTRARPDLVLLDINLVGASGLDVLPRLLAIEPKATVVMLTAVNMRRAVEDARAKGASGYILKDVDQNELAAAIVEVVQERFGSARGTPGA